MWLSLIGSWWIKNPNVYRLLCNYVDRQNIRAGRNCAKNTFSTNTFPFEVFQCHSNPLWKRSQYKATPMWWSPPLSSVIQGGRHPLDPVHLLFVTGEWEWVVGEAGRSGANVSLPYRVWWPQSRHAEPLVHAHISHLPYSATRFTPHPLFCCVPLSSTIQFKSCDR